MRHNIKNTKKVFMLMAAMLLLSMPLRSQVFLTQDEVDFDQAEPWVPAGSGIAMLAALGGAYLLGKRKKED